VTRQSVEARTRSGIGRTFQRGAVIPRFAALDMVRLAALNNAGLALLSSLSANKPATARARAALGRVGLAERESVAADVLSHGEKRRLEIAAVLALEPKILLLDEPLAGLGADESRDVVVLIEHDIDVVFALADRITVLDNGRMIACGAPAEVRASEAVQQAYLGLDQP
jgi:branched-chain amino acid transport system ATP-binding protein